MKKILALLLVFTLLLCAVPAQLFVFAEETPADVIIVDDEAGVSIGLTANDGTVTMVGSKSLRSFPNNGSLAYSGIYGANPLSEPKDISTIVGTDGTSGALRFWFYIQDVSVLNDTKFISGQGQVQIGSGKKTDTDIHGWANWLDQVTKNGWNEVVLPFSSGWNSGTPDFTAVDTLWFRLYDTAFKTTVYIDDIRVSANTEHTPVPADVVLVDDEAGEGMQLANPTDEQAKVGSKSLKSIMNNGAIAYAGFWDGDPVEPKDISTVTSNGKNGALRFWFYVEDVATLEPMKALLAQNKYSYVKIGSYEHPDYGKYMWPRWLNQVTKSGWNEVILKFSDAWTDTSKEIDLTQIDTLYFMFADTTFNTTVYLDDIRVTADTETRNRVDIPKLGLSKGTTQRTIELKGFEADASKINNPYFKISVYVAKTADTSSSVSDIVSAWNGLELSNSGKSDNSAITWEYIRFQPGWNTIYLPFSNVTKYKNGSTGAFDISKPINYFRYIQGTSTNVEFQVKVKELAIVDGSDVPEQNLVLSGSTTGVGTKSISKNRLLFNDGKTASGDTVPKINVSSIPNPHLQISVYIARDDDNSSVEGLLKWYEIELTSSGKSDKAEISWNPKNFSLKAGWNTLLLPFSKASATSDGVEFDKTAINYFRMYHTPADDNVSYTLQVKDVKIVSFSETYAIDSIYGNGMLFQQNKDVVITGSGKIGDVVDVAMSKVEDGTVVSTAQTTVDNQGRFTVTLDGQKGGYTEYDINFTVGSEVVATLEEVVFGELWLAAGQSNMELSMSQDLDGKAIVANPTDKYIKILTVGYSSDDGLPSDPVDGRTGAYWGDGTNASAVSGCSAVGYYQATVLREELDMPIGIIDANKGGTSIYAWLSREAIENNAEVLANAKADGYYVSKDAWNSTKQDQMTAQYNAKISLLDNLSIAGTIWYQGCANVNDPTGHYSAALELLLESYSDLFGFENNSMPLIVSHLHPYDFNNRNAAKFNNEFSAVVAKYPGNVSQIAIYDLPVEYDGNVPIHPTRKQDIGKRMGNAALGLVYGKNDTVTSPSFENATPENGAMLVKFKNLGTSSLAAKNGNALDGFAIAGADGVYMPAKAEIVSADTVKVWNISITNPTAVTYAYTAVNNTANLVSVDANGKVLFAVVPFCSDVRDDDTLYRPVAWLSTEALSYWRSSGSADNACWRDIWATDSTATTVALDTANKTDGASSLKVSYTANAFSIAPITTYYYETSLEKYGRLIFDIKTANELTLNITAEKTYTIKASDEWQRFTLDLSDIADMSELTFAFASVATKGEVYIDNLSLLAVTLDGDVDNNAEVCASDLVMLRKSLLGTIAEIGITDVNKDGYTNILDLVRLKKMLAN